jgi:hypothetical protein
VAEHANRILSRPAREFYLPPEAQAGIERLPGGGKLMSRLFQALLGRTLSLLEIHATIFPNEYFFPESSPNKVHQALHRLRAGFRRWEWPLIVEEKGGRYALGALPGQTVLIGAWDPSAPCSAEMSALRDALPRLPTPSFSSRELSGVLGLSRRSAQRYLSHALRFGIVKRAPDGIAGRYQRAD